MHKSTAKRVKSSSDVTPYSIGDTQKNILVKLCKENIMHHTNVVQLGEICF